MIVINNNDLDNLMNTLVYEFYINNKRLSIITTHSCVVLNIFVINRNFLLIQRINTVNETFFLHVCILRLCKHSDYSTNSSIDFIDSW